MRKLRRRLQEVKLMYYGMRAYDSILDFLVMLLLFAVIAQLVNVSLWTAVALAAAAALLLFVQRMLEHTNLPRAVEESEPSFDGSLLTAIEHKEESNAVVDHLLSKVSDRMKVVDFSTFFNSERVTEKTLLAVFLAFLFLSVTVIRFQDFFMEGAAAGALFGKARDALSNAENILEGGGGIWESSEKYSNPEEEDELGAESGGEKPGFSEGPLPGEGSGVGTEGFEDIYGEPESANLWGEELDMEIHPEFGGDVDVDVKARDVESDSFKLPEVEAGEEFADYPLKQAELVRKYFEKLMEEGG